MLLPCTGPCFLRKNQCEPCRHSPTERIALQWKMVKISGVSHHNKANSNWERETLKRCKLQRVRNKQNAPLEDNEGIKEQILMKEIGFHMKDIFRMLTKWQKLKRPSFMWRESEDFTGCNCASWMCAEQSLGMHFLITSYLLWSPSSKACSVSFSHLG